MADSDKSKTQKLQFSLDLRLLVLFLAAVIVGMLIAWRPWEASPDANARTIEVVGEAKIDAEPDEYVFYPTYDFESANEDEALAQMSGKSTEVVAKLKELGVADNKIKTNSDGYDKYYFAPSDDGQPTYTLRLEVRVGDREQAQKIQDYLVTTSPMGQVSPIAGFSDEKRKELEAEARDAATKDARAKADQSARNLGFSIGKVKSVTDGSGFGGIEPMYARDTASIEGGTRSSLQIQPGENEIRYTVSVSYYLK